MRVGLGYDLHRLEEGLPLILGGVHIPHSKGCVAHSDGDALSHAITDAILGAAALGNIGEHFPDTDPRYAGSNSLDLLREAQTMLVSAGYSIVNIDSNIIAQQPKLNPHIAAIRAKLAVTLNMDIADISVKAKTNESVGPEGREEAIRTEAIVLVQRNA